jgi:hypothetical protein
MTISKSTQPYDRADGAAQPSGAGAAAAAAGQRWEDDGGPLQVQPPISPPLKDSTKPTWSVLSLRDLNLAIRLGHWPDNPAPLQRAAAEAGRARARARARASAAAATAEARENDGSSPKENT